MSIGRLSLYFVVTAILFMSLSWAWAILGPAYGAAFRSVGNVVLPDSPERIISFVPLHEPGELHDTELVMVDVPSKTKGKTAISSRRHGYMPTALLIALFLATPLPWSSRLVLLGMGLLLVSIYIAAKFGLMPLAYDPSHLRTTAAGVEAGDTAASRLLWAVSGSSVGWALVPVLIYAVLVLRPKENRRLLLRTEK